MSARANVILVAALVAAAALPASAAARAIPLAAVVTPSATSAAAPSGPLGPGPLRPRTGRRLSPAGAPGPAAAAVRPAAAPATVPSASLVRSFDGISHRDQVLANGGSDFATAEPPDQGLCVGHGFVTEAVNAAVRVYDGAGAPVGSARSLNGFFGYPPELSATGDIGPFITDPSCLFDPVTQRWFLVVLTLDLDPATGAFLGPNHLDLAVSRTADPTGAWAIYHLPVQDDGTQGTPNHHCSASGPGTGDGPCIGDYPHIGADTNGIYLTTNEYSQNGPEFHGAQVYALSKAALVSGAGSVAVDQIDTHGLDQGNSGFTLWPAASPTGQGDPAAGGTEYLLSSNAGAEAHGDGTGPGPGSSNQLLVWALTNTRSLDAATPAVGLSHTVVAVAPYFVPPAALQKPGDVPLADCLNDPSCSTGVLGSADPFAPELEGPLDSNDTRMQQVSYAAGRIWGALDTGLTSGGQTRAGIEWFVAKPSAATGQVTATLVNQGYTGVAGGDLTYPAIGMTSSGGGVMAFTASGPGRYPSAGYAAITDAGVGPVAIAGAGAGPTDGLTEYKVFGAPPGTIGPRWGDYGAAAVDGASVWTASEYIGHTCDFAAFVASGGSCGGTRTTLANWDTRISQLTPPAPCEHTIGSSAGSLTLRGPGSYCVRDAAIAGSVTATGGATVTISGSDIRGGIVASGSGAFALCDSTLAAGLTVRGATGLVRVGDGGDDGLPACGGNRIGGGVGLSGNRAGVELAGNRIGAGATVAANLGGGSDPETGRTEIEGNRIAAGLRCPGNQPPAINDGQPNAVGGGDLCGL